MMKYLNIIFIYTIFTTSQTFASDDLSTVYESENEDVSTVSSDYSEDNRSISSETPDDPSLADGSYSILKTLLPANTTLQHLIIKCFLIC